MKYFKKIIRWMAFCALQGVALFVRYPSWRFGVRIGGWLGVMMFYLLKKERTRSIESLKVAYGSQRSTEELSRIVRKNFRNLGKGLVEILNLQYLKPHQIDALISIEGEEYLKEAASRGKGIILITGHCGNWELLGAAMAIRGYPLHVIAAPLYDPRIDEWIIRLRSRFNIATISRGSPSSSRKILNVLRKKEMLALLIDQDTRVDGVFVNFFNKKANTPSGAARLALRSGATTIMFFIARLSGDRHQITIHKPVALTRTSDAEKDVETNTAQFTSTIEAHIRQYPDQWVWMHRRWRTKP